MCCINARDLSSLPLFLLLYPAPPPASSSLDIVPLRASPASSAPPPLNQPMQLLQAHDDRPPWSRSMRLALPSPSRAPHPSNYAKLFCLHATSLHLLISQLIMHHRYTGFYLHVALTDPRRPHRRAHCGRERRDRGEQR